MRIDSGKTLQLFERAALFIYTQSHSKGHEDRKG